MPINSKHPLYENNIETWKRCRDAMAGGNAVKAAAETYLPRPAGFKKDEYDGYLFRALFYEAVGRTIEGFVGAVARKDAVVKVPAKLEPVVADITSDGFTLQEFNKQLCSEAMLQGRLGILVDFDEKLQRAYATLYTVESITNWADGLVVLFETVYEPDPDDRFKLKAVEQYRELSLVEGVYTVTVWRKPQIIVDGIEWIVHETKTPTQRGKALDAIPFFWLTPLGKTSRIEKPPLLGLVDVCMSHYLNSADLEHGRHFTGLPTLYITGCTSDEPIHVGSTAAILLPEANAKVGYAEFNGQGLASLETALATKEAMMAVLGAAVFHRDGKGVEAAETARIRTSGETNLLAGIVTAVEEAILAVLQCAAAWMSVTDAIEVTLNRDFVDTKLDGPTLTGLVAAYQSGGLSLQQFLYNLQQGELLAPDTDIEQEAASLEATNAKKAEDAAKLAAQTKQPKP